ncbi:MAG: 1-pyrroline-5-carboxylate dehydrogenase, partial [Desulfobacterales bacterium]
MNLINNAAIEPPKPVNEPILAYTPGSKEKVELQSALAEMAATVIDIPVIIGGKEIRTGDLGQAVMPHDHRHVLATYHKAGPEEVRLAIDTAVETRKVWSQYRWEERAAVFLKAAELIATKYRAKLNAGAMLAGGKNVFQAEIDA